MHTVHGREMSEITAQNNRVFFFIKVAEMAHVGRAPKVIVNPAET
jgi:hypothetical protein